MTGHLKRFLSVKNASLNLQVIFKSCSHFWIKKTYDYSTFVPFLKGEKLCLCHLTTPVMRLILV